MTTEKEIHDLLRELGALCPMGYVAALQIGFHTPEFLLQSLPLAWTDHYAASGLVLHDPILAWGMRNTGLRRWSDIEGAADSPVMQSAKDHGLCFGLIHSNLAHGKRSICSAARQDREFDADETARISTLFERLHQLTRDLDAFSDALRADLRALSLRINHAGSA